MVWSRMISMRKVRTSKIRYCKCRKQQVIPSQYSSTIYISWGETCAWLIICTIFLWPFNCLRIWISLSTISRMSSRSIFCDLPTYSLSPCLMRSIFPNPPAWNKEKSSTLQYVSFLKMTQLTLWHMLHIYLLTLCQRLDSFVDFAFYSHCHLRRFHFL